ncbi:Trm112 family protein [Aquifex sp.]
MLDKELLDVLACPKCKGEVKYLEEKGIIVCENCRVYYEVREGIPVMLPDEAKPLDESSAS